MPSINDVKADLKNSIDPKLVDSLFEHFYELQSRYVQGDFEPSELNGGKFAETATRIIQFLTSGQFTPLGRHIPRLAQTLDSFEQLPSRQHNESLRKHIPRVLKAVCEVRNNRGVGHTPGDINPNFMDASLVLANCSWVLAEFIRLQTNMNETEAQAFVDSLVSRPIPVIQDIEGYPKILYPEFSVPNKTLLLLYFKGSGGIERSILVNWLERERIKKDTILKSLQRLDTSADIHVHENGNVYLTDKGQSRVEEVIRDTRG